MSAFVLVTDSEDGGRIRGAICNAVELSATSLRIDWADRGVSTGRNGSFVAQRSAPSG